MRKRAIGKTEAKSPAVESITPGGQYGEVVALQLDGVGPVSGHSYYIILGKEKQQIELFHPFTFTKFKVALEIFHESLVPNDWNPSHQRLAEFLAGKILTQKQLKREIPLYVSALAKHFEDLSFQQ